VQRKKLNESIRKKTKTEIPRCYLEKRLPFHLLDEKSE
jgi:hypothetical protein